MQHDNRKQNLQKFVLIFQSTISKKYEITPKTIQNWKKHFLSNASMAFEPAKVVSEYKTEIEELKSQNDELAKALGKATIERDWALGRVIVKCCV
ncbi:integrase (plasmid) [Candidatus Megaera polyxenophila]|nr:integrase [Candidatus Megaera polyxenophila]